MIPFGALERLGDEFWAEMEKTPANYYVAGKKAGAFISQSVQDIIAVFPVAKGVQLRGKLSKVTGKVGVMKSMKKTGDGFEVKREPDATPTKNPDAQTPSGQPVVKPAKSPPCGIIRWFTPKEQLAPGKRAIYRGGESLSFS